MRKLLLFFLLTPILVFGQKSKRMKIDEGIYDDQYEVIKINKKKIKNGNFQRSDSEGSITYISGQYSNDQRSGTWTYTNSSGLLAKGEYSDGKIGFWTYSHPMEQINFTFDHSNDSIISYQHNDKLYEVWIGNSFVQKEIDRIPLSMDFDTKFHRELNYPFEAMKFGIEGKCLLEIIIDESGDIESKSIIRDIGAGTGEEIIRAVNESWTNSISAVKDSKPIKIKRYLLIEYKTPPVMGDSNYKITWSWR